MYEQREREHDTAAQALRSTSSFLTEDVYDDFTYSIMTHHWRAPFQFSLETDREGAPPERQLGQLRFEDEEHVGFRPARLAEDPLEVPGPQAYSRAFLQQLAPALEAVVGREGQARAATRRAACASLPADWGTEWVQCWAEASLWENGSQPGYTALLSLLAASRDSPPPQCR